MGMELIDMTFRAERQFGIKSRLEEFAKVSPKDEKYRLTAGDFHAWVCTACREQGKPVPHSSWNRVKIVIVDAAGVTPSIIRKSSRLYDDLGVG
jgi:hypothetical protein